MFPLTELIYFKKFKFIFQNILKIYLKNFIFFSEHFTGIQQQSVTGGWIKNRLISPKPAENYIIFFIFHSGTAASGPGSPLYLCFTITLRHTTIGRTPLDEWSARRRDLSLATHNTHNTEISMSLAGIRTCNPSKQAVTDRRLRQCSQ